MTDKLTEHVLCFESQKYVFCFNSEPKNLEPHSGLITKAEKYNSSVLMYYIFFNPCTAQWRNLSHIKQRASSAGEGELKHIAFHK